MTSSESAPPLPSGEHEPARPPDVRVGSATDGLTPLAVAERSLAASLVQWLALAAITLTAVGADQLTKYVVTSHLRLDDGLHVVGPFWIHHVRNSGIAFGLFAGAAPVVVVLTGIAVLWMLVYFARSGARHPVLPIALGLVIGGSVSNLLDRVRLGYVTDFLDFRYWPAFNLADSFIVIGVGILLAALVAVDRAPRRPRAPQAPGPAAAGRRRLGRRRPQPPRPVRDAPARR